MRLDDANDKEAFAYFDCKGEMPSEKENLNTKFQYIEAVIRFLNLYCQNELGSGEADIQKVCLWVNSPYFENMELHLYQTQEDIYKALEEQLVNNIPLYRLLNISAHLKKILEQDHIEQLQKQLIQDAEKHPCLKCVWYECSVHSLGLRSLCKRPETSIEMSRRSFLDIDKITKCKYCTDMHQTPKAIEKALSETNFWHSRTEAALKRARERWQRAFDSLDNSVIPKVFETFDLQEIRSYDKQELVMLDLGRAFGNKQPLMDIADNLQGAFLVKAMIEFIETFAQIELGSDYTADISKIAEFVYTARRNRTLIPELNSEEEVFRWLENQILAGEDMTKFCKSISM